MRKSHGILLLIGIILAAILVLSASTIWSYYEMEFQKQTIVKERVKSGDMKYIYDFYVSSSPNLDGRLFYGSEKAPITIILYSDIRSNATRYFMKEIFPSLNDTYIKVGKARFIHKNYITREDIDSKSENYQYLMALSCFGRIDPEHYYDVYFDLGDIGGISQIPSLAQKYNISAEDFNSCFAGSAGNDLNEDLSEVDNFGMIGLQPRLYIGFGPSDSTVVDGIPSLSQLALTMKYYQIQMGD